MLFAVCAVFLHRFEHDDDVFNGHIPLNVVNGVEDKSADRHQIVKPALYILTYLLGSAGTQNTLGINAAAPEGDVFAEFTFELRGIHAICTDLHRVDDVTANLDQIGDDGADRATGVEKDLGITSLMNE